MRLSCTILFWLSLDSFRLNPCKQTDARHFEQIYEWGNSIDTEAYYYSMFSDLLEQLEPHFKKMGLKTEDIKHTAARKHAPNRAQRRSLK